MFSIAITLDEKTYDMYKHYNSDNYVNALKLKYKEMQKKNPKLQIPDLEKEKKNFLKPYNIRKTVANNYKVLFGLNYISGRDITEEEYDLYAIICLLDISLDDNYGNVNSLLKKYKDYLYLSTTRKYLNRNNNKKLINELKSEIKKVDNVDKFNLNLNLNKCIESIILKFDALDIYNKYFEKPS